MLSAHIRFCIAPVSDQKASTPPMLSTLIAVPLCCVMFLRLPSSRVVACPGTIPLSLPTSVVTAWGPATRLKSPTATSNADGIARNA